MGNTLIVVRPFAAYRVGTLIDNPAQIKEALSGEHAHNVVRIAAPGRGAPKTLEG